MVGLVEALAERVVAPRRLDLSLHPEEPALAHRRALLDVQAVRRDEGVLDHQPDEHPEGRERDHPEPPVKPPDETEDSETQRSEEREPAIARDGVGLLV